MYFTIVFLPGGWSFSDFYHENLMGVLVEKARKVPGPFLTLMLAIHFPTIHQNYHLWTYQFMASAPALAPGKQTQL